MSFFFRNLYDILKNSALEELSYIKKKANWNQVQKNAVVLYAKYCTLCKMGAIFSSVAHVSPEKLEKIVLGFGCLKEVSIE